MRKVFIGGLAKNATEPQLEQYFSKFGKIDDILINRSSKTGGCKGCAFILFKETGVAKRLIADPSRHNIGGKMVEVKSCHKKGSKSKPSVEGKQSSENKIFLKSTAQSTHSLGLKNLLSSPYTQATLTGMISPIAPLASPLPDIKFTPLEELEDDLICLEEPIKKKVQTM